MMKLVRCDPAQGGVGSEGIIEGLNVSEDSGVSGAPGGKPLQMNHFTLEATEEIFSDSIVIGVTLAGHALANLKLGKCLPEGQGSILDTAIAVEDEAWCGTFPANRHFQSVCRKGGVKAARGGMANYLLRTEVFDDGGIKPALIGGDVGDVAYPDRVGLGRVELAAQQVWSNGIRMPGIGGGLVGPLAQGVDVCRFHQPMDAPPGTSVIRLKQVVNTVQT